jgi:hypothetical protein
MYIGALPPQVPNTLVAVSNSSNSANIINCFRSGLDSYNIFWVLARTRILYGTGVSYKNTVAFPQSTVYIDNNQGISNNLNLVNNMYSFDVTYVNDTGPSPIVKTNPIGNLQYNVTNLSKTFPYTNTSLISLAGSSNGIIMVAGANTSGYLWTTRDRGVNWVQAIGPGARAWNVVACSSDGTKMIAADASPGYIWTSSDSGVTWTRRDGPGSRAWAAVGISFDGTKAIAAAPDVNIYTSSDSGQTWATPSTSFTLSSYSGISISNDGTTLFAAENVTGGHIRKSTNSGSTWTSITNATSEGILPVTAGWRAFRMVSDKTTLILGNGFGGSLYITYDSGITWTRINTEPLQAPYTGINISSDYNNIVFISKDSGAAYYSRNGGSTWFRAQYTDLNNTPSWWSALTGDSTGQYLTAIVNNGIPGSAEPTPNTGKIWFSHNYGEFWYTYANPGSYPWASVGISQDATTLVASGLPSYMSTDSGITWKMLNFTNLGPQTINNASVFISADNTMIAIAIAVNSNSGSQLYISRNSGNTWVQPDISQFPTEGFFPPYGLTGVAGSFDGSILIVGLVFGALYISRDSGVTWYRLGTGTNQFFSTPWSAVASNSTGTQFIATGGNRQQLGFVWINRNSGIGAWTRLTDAPIGARNWSSVASNSTGQYLYLCSGTYAGSQGIICASADYGVTWTQCAGIPNANWSSITCSRYGMNVIASIKGGTIWASYDFGLTWNESVVTGSDNWLSIGCSANALSIIAINSGSTTITPQNGVIKMTQLTG